MFCCRDNEWLISLSVTVTDWLVSRSVTQIRELKQITTAGATTAAATEKVWEEYVSVV